MTFFWRLMTSRVQACGRTILELKQSTLELFFLTCNTHLHVLTGLLGLFWTSAYTGQFFLAQSVRRKRRQLYCKTLVSSYIFPPRAVA